MQLGNQNLPLYSQESNSEFSKLQSLLEAKKWWLPIEKQSLCWATTSPIFVVGTSGRWDVDAIELLSKYGLTPQLEIGQKVGGSNCRTCEGQIKEFSKQVGWNMELASQSYTREVPSPVSNCCFIKLAKLCRQG